MPIIANEDGMYVLINNAPFVVPFNTECARVRPRDWPVECSTLHDLPQVKLETPPSSSYSPHSRSAPLLLFDSGHKNELFGSSLQRGGADRNQSSLLDHSINTLRKERLKLMAKRRESNKPSRQKKEVLWRDLLSSSLNGNTRLKTPGDDSLPISAVGDAVNKTNDEQIEALRVAFSGLLRHRQWLRRARTGRTLGPTTVAHDFLYSSPDIPSKSFSTNELEDRFSVSPTGILLLPMCQKDGSSDSRVGNVPGGFCHSVSIYPDHSYYLVKFVGEHLCFAGDWELCHPALSVRAPFASTPVPSSDPQHSRYAKHHHLPEDGDEETARILGGALFMRENPSKTQEDYEVLQLTRNGFSVEEQTDTVESSFFSRSIFSSQATPSNSFIDNERDAEAEKAETADYSQRCWNELFS